MKNSNWAWRKRNSINLGVNHEQKLQWMNDAKCMISSAQCVVTTTSTWSCFGVVVDWPYILVKTCMENKIKKIYLFPKEDERGGKNERWKSCKQMTRNENSIYFVCLLFSIFILFLFMFSVGCECSVGKEKDSFAWAWKLWSNGGNGAYSHIQIETIKYTRIIMIKCDAKMKVEKKYVTALAVKQFMSDAEFESKYVSAKE